MVVRAASLLRPRGDRGITHRRLVETIPGSHVDDATDPPWNTFRGATARFVAFG